MYPRTKDFYKLPIEFTPVISGNTVEIGITLDKSKLTHGRWSNGKYSGTHHGYDNEQLLVNEILNGLHGWQVEDGRNIIEEMENNEKIS